MKHYLTLYSSGMCGTWITWFISQHSNFHKYKSETIRTDNIITDLRCDGATWCFAPDDQDNAPDEAMTFEEYQKRWMIPESNNPSATKNCIKILPDHDLSWDEHQNSDIRQKLIKPMTGVIIPYLKPDSPFVNMLVNRNIFMWPDMDQMHETETIEEFWTLAINNTRKDVTNGKYNFCLPYTKVHYLNLESILMCEEHEYKALRDFIGEEPLDKWEDLVNNYRMQYICKDWRKLIKASQDNQEK